MLNIELQTFGPVHVLKCVGTIMLGDKTDEAFGNAVRCCIYGEPIAGDHFDLAKGRSIWLMVDLNQVDYIDTAGITALVMAFAEVTYNRGSMKLLCSNPRILDLLHVEKLHSVFDILESVETHAEAFAYA